SRLSSGRLVFQLPGQTPVLAERGPKVSPGTERGGDAIYPAGSAASGSMGVGDFQPGIFRATVVVNVGDGSSHRPLPCQCRRFRSRTCRLRRGDGWNRIRTARGVSARPRFWIRCRIFIGRHLSRGCIRYYSCYRSGGSVPQFGTKIELSGSLMRIKEVRTRVMRWRGKTVPLPPHFCANPLDVLNLPEASMQTFAFHGWLV